MDDELVLILMLFVLMLMDVCDADELRRSFLLYLSPNNGMSLLLLAALPRFNKLDRDFENVSVTFLVYDDIVFHFLLATLGSIPIFLASSFTPRGKVVGEENMITSLYSKFSAENTLLQYTNNRLLFSADIIHHIPS